MKCPVVANFGTDCPGDDYFYCYEKNEFSTLGMSQFKDGVGSCIRCPSKAKCDGHEMTRCPIGFKLNPNNKLICSPCTGD